MVKDEQRPQVPEDVAALYSWAGLRGMGYHDFAASRREYRAKGRSGAEQLRKSPEPHLQLPPSPFPQTGGESAPTDRPFSSQEPAKAAADSSRDAITATAAESKPSDEMLPQRSAKTRDIRHIVPQSRPFYPSRAASAEESPSETPARAATSFANEAKRPDALPAQVPLSHGFEPKPSAAVVFIPVSNTAPTPSGTFAPVRSEPSGESASGSRPAESAPELLTPEAQAPGIPIAVGQLQEPFAAVAQPAEVAAPASREPKPTPAASQEESSGPAMGHEAPADRPDRMADRWFALQSSLDRGLPQATDASGRMQAPLLMVYSLAGGVGKTSLAANLGRELAGSGESVLLAEVTTHAVLPFYFGSTDVRLGAVRTFSPPANSTGAAIHVVSYDALALSGDAKAQDAVEEELIRSGALAPRVILDLAPSAMWLARRLAGLNTIVIIPLAPDMNSVISLGPIERMFSEMAESGASSTKPFYLLNEFDASLKLHADVQQALEQRFGERLLPFVVHRSPAVSEALAEGMTVRDYSAEASATAGYASLAKWLREQSATSAMRPRRARWSER